MTYGDELREEGKQEGMTIGEEKGRQEGRQEEKYAVARNMLCNLRLGIDVITKATGLSTREVIRLAS